jgi:hypothetical protein
MAMTSPIIRTMRAVAALVAIALPARLSAQPSLTAEPCPSPVRRGAVPGDSTRATPTDTARPARPTSTIAAGVRGAADILLLAEVHAREVRFAKQPEIRVRLCGGMDSVRVVERRNLPSPVVVGTTYRNVYVAVEVLGRVDAECLASRLGVTGAARDSTSGPCAAIEIRGRDDAPARRPP